jgi:GGDEF domain-containing protein
LPAASPYSRQESKRLSYVHPAGSTALFNGTVSSGFIVEGLYVTLSQEALFIPLRDAMLMLFAVVTILLSGLLFSSKQARSMNAGNSPASTRTVLPIKDASETSLYSEELFEPSTKPDAAVSRQAPENESAIQANETVSHHNAPTIGNIRPGDLPEGILDGPRGLFDPESGLGWEAYLRDRLSAELRRSASFEQDLSFMICSLDDAVRGEEEFNLFAASVRDFFSFKDMAFLFGTGSVALMLPNMDVDHALRMSDELMKKLLFMFQSRKSADGGPGIHIGLTSRAGRLVDADRLIGEAMAAISKARTDGGSRIMAFRPDPEKFRAYLAGN